MNDAIFDKLDEQQSAAVRHIHGPALIVAGAGAGKTTTLVRRVAYLIRNGVAPQNILLLTFTRAAAKSITDRARKFEPLAENIKSGTFHAIASNLIRENHKSFNLPSGFTVLDPSDCEDAIKILSESDSDLKGGPRASTIAKIISYATNTKQDVKRVVEQDNPKYISYTDSIAKISTDYIDYKRRNQVVDYDDLLKAFAAMANHPVAGENLRKRYTHVMVDESQDNNALQMDIVYGLGGQNGSNVVMVGDPAQSIYKFRGAAPGTMFDFKRKYPNSIILPIETNYRSTPEIVECANKIDNAMSPRFDRTLKAFRDSQAIKPHLVKVPDTQKQAKWIVNRIIENFENGERYDHNAVLVRTSRFAREVELELTAHDIPYRFIGGIKINEAAHVKDFICPLRIASNPMDESAMIRSLTMFPGIGVKGAIKFAREICHPDHQTIINNLRDHAFKKPVFLKVVDIIECLNRQDIPLFDRLCDAIKILEPVLEKKYDDEWDWRKKDINALIDISARHNELEDFLRMITIDLSIDKSTSGQHHDVPEDGLVTVSTIHGSKGLEWDHVFIPSFTNSHMPSPYALEPESYEEEKRLFYVASTRAKTNLYFLHPLTMLINNENVGVSPSSFLRLINSCYRIEHGVFAEIDYDKPIVKPETIIAF